MPDVCDFCADPDPTWLYPAPTFDAFDVPGGRAESVGAWRACDDCHGLIDAGDRAGLVDRALGTFICQFPSFADNATQAGAFIRRLHQKFFDHRAGAAQRIKP